jgi:outer membrane murein-binding lipoprotein Lpp
MLRHRVFRQILLFIVVGLVSILFAIGFVPEMSLSQQPDARLNSLEFDFRNLESRLDRLENQLGRTSRPTSRTPTSDNRRRDRPLTQAQSFDNLATLVIELKQQVNKLEARVKKLETGSRE